MKQGKKKPWSKLRKAINDVAGLSVVVGGLLGVLGAFYRAILPSAIGGGLFLIGIGLHIIFCRCPHCRKFLGGKSGDDRCPFCGKSLNGKEPKTEE